MRLLSEIRTSLDFEWLKRSRVAKGLNFQWDLKSGSLTILNWNNWLPFGHILGYFYIPLLYISLFHHASGYIFIKVLKLKCHLIQLLFAILEVLMAHLKTRIQNSFWYSNVKYWDPTVMRNTSGFWIPNQSSSQIIGNKSSIMVIYSNPNIRLFWHDKIE